MKFRPGSDSVHISALCRASGLCCGRGFLPYPRSQTTSRGCSPRVPLGLHETPPSPVSGRPSEDRPATGLRALPSPCVGYRMCRGRALPGGLSGVPAASPVGVRVATGGSGLAEGAPGWAGRVGAGCRGAGVGGERRGPCRTVWLGHLRAPPVLGAAATGSRMHGFGARDTLFRVARGPAVRVSDAPGQGSP